MKWIVTTLFICVGMVAFSQNTTELKRRAKEFFAAGRYEDALTTLNSSRELSQADEEGRFLLAICYFQVNRLNESLAILKNLTENEKTPYPECWFYLGKIYHARHQFLEAAVNYKMFLRNTDADDNIRHVIADMVRRCSNGQQIQYQQAKAFVENLGPQVNTKYDEFAPVLSPNYEDRLYFSSIRQGNAGGKRNAQGKPDEYSGRYFSDMYFCRNYNGAWSNVQPMPYQLNSPQHEVLLDFNKDGNALIYFKGMDLKKGTIIVDTFRQLEQRLVSSDPLMVPVHPLEGDEAPFFYNDTLILFASARPGGYGGRDIYKTVYRNGKWTTPQNLGTDINTPYDETSPFLSRDGRTLYFSSDNPERSIGGLDVFKTIFIPEINRWTEPKNLGLPINSAGNDDNFRLANDGFTGFLDSDRKDGIGMRDLYIAYFNDYLAEQDLPALDVAFEPPQQPGSNASKPSMQNVVAEYKKPVEPQGNEIPSTQSTSNNILYFSTLDDLLTTAHQKALDEFGIDVAGNAEQKLVLTVYALAPSSISSGLYDAITYAQQAAAYLMDKGVAPESIFMRGAVKVESYSGASDKYAMLLETPQTTDFVEKGENKQSLDPMLHQGLHYKIQVASLKGAYNKELIRQFPHAMVEKTPNFEYLRYTVGAVSTFAEAQRLRQEVIAKGGTGAYIVPYIKEIRADVSQVKQYKNVFPDLVNFLNQ